MSDAFPDMQTKEVISREDRDFWVSDEGRRRMSPPKFLIGTLKKSGRAAHSTWNQNLSRIKVETPTRDTRTIFYTALYHLIVAPTLFDDVDGQYRGMDGKIHQLPAGAAQLQHLFPLGHVSGGASHVHPVQPDRVPDFVNCLIRMAQESPAGVPIWPLQGRETFCMTGYHSSSVYAEACVKGFKGIDFEAGVSAAPAPRDGRRLSRPRAITASSATSLATKKKSRSARPWNMYTTIGQLRMSRRRWGRWTTTSC